MKNRGTRVSGVVLEARGISAGYRQPGTTRGRGAMVVKNASFTLSAGQLLCVLGPNGSGKTTLLKTCIHLLKPLAGSAYIMGRDVASLKPRELARLAAWVPQQSSAAWAYTARELVCQGRYAALGPFAPFTQADHEAVEKAMNTLDILEFADRPFSRLSGGEARRVLIARALAQDTPLLVLDEPAAHLDPGRQLELLEVLSELAALGKAVAVSIHDVNAARRFADDFLLLNRRGTAYFGKSDAILSPERLEDAFDTEFLHGQHEDYGRYVLPLARRKKGSHDNGEQRSKR